MVSAITSMLHHPFDARSIPVQPAAYTENDPTVEFFYRPRTLSVLSAIGAMAGVGFFLLFAMLQFRDGPFIRPHPVIWRIVLGLGVLYQMFLVFLLFQNKRDARYIFATIDPSLGRPLPERSYADNCELTIENIKDQMDIFVVYHASGWFAKALVLRDYWFCWILSVMFEVMEYSLQHQLNNFAECWWDHWILDVIICNWAGLYLGMKTCEYFEMKGYSWRGIKQIPSLKGKMKRTVQQFTPHHWTKFEWGTTKKHPLNAYRFILLFFCAIPGTREAYQYLTDKDCKRLGPQAWLTIANIMTESVICFKFGRGEFPNPAPTSVIIFWTILISSLVIYAIWQFGIPYWKKKETKTQKIKQK
ncbi:6905_t:CDS:2 [Entrophospora sp. SA101]|nr:15860_t:CDS:2 [Entrophospora sp. SA101]CAJ0841546.1 15867_t:CDS:2 [Entrophospora sp. SA101]CAJ0921677.1 6905_t:CDS:2 [Entrophospora sp. SA101]